MRTFIIAFFILLPGLVGAQLRADFATDKEGGCSPLQISITNTTVGASVNAKYHWDFGNGNTSVLKNAGVIYYEEKAYIITLTVNDGSQTSVRTKTITVYKKPTIEFAVSPVKGCLPLMTTFTSSSNPGDGNFQSYYWDFGDGTTGQSSGNTITHVYNAEQVATVSLTGITNYGCAATLTKRDLVTVRPSLQASFDVDQTIFCDAPANAQFTNYSSGPGTLTYAWDFGDGTSSTLRSPSHTYTAKGVYSVKMTVTSSEGCVQTREFFQYINVGNFKTDFIVPALICTSQSASFQSNSAPAASYSQWIIDGASTYYTYNNNPINHVFTTAGMHTMELINNFGICQQAVTKQVEVKKSTEMSGFLVDITGLCGVPVKVNFRDTTPDAISWKWRFQYFQNNPGVPDNIQAPSYIYTNNDIHPVTLSIVNRDGCPSSVTKYVGITAPVVGIFLDPASKLEACTNLTVKLETRSTEQITSYAWNFGDGGTSTDPNPTHTYQQPGTYVPKLTYTTINGCTGTVNFGNEFKVRQKPVANFSVQPTVCGNTPVSFLNQTTGYTTNFLWDFGEGGGFRNNFSNLFQYYEEGEYTIKLIAYNGLCNDTITKPAIIKVSPPFPKISEIDNTCDGTRGLVTFKEESRKTDSWTWDFGDGTAPVTYTAAQPEISHTYANSGRYRVLLKNTRGACTVGDSIYVSVLLKQSPLLSLDKTEFCQNTGVGFNIKNLEPNPAPINVYSNSYSFERVEYGDGSVFNGVIANAFFPWKTTMNGILSFYELKDNQLRAIIQSAFFNCMDTTNYVPMKINGIKPGFEVVLDNECFRSPVVLRDTSKASGGNRLKSWEWIFGDGTSQILTQGGEVSHIYSQPGIYYPILRVRDESGCQGEFYTTRMVQVSGPKVAFSASGSTVQLNTTVNFYNNSNTYNANGTNWRWDFGNGNTSTLHSPSNQYTQAGTYTVTLIGTNPVTGCADTAKTTIIVRNFNTGFTRNATMIGNNNQCPPILVNFSNTSSNYTRLEWDFGDGFTLINQPYPSHVYNVPGTYIVTLYVTGYNGLSDIFRDTIIVGQPKATIAADDLEGCIGHQLTLHAPVHTLASSYYWDFGDGHLVNATDSFAKHQFQTAGSYSPSLLVKDNRGCASYVALPDKIIVHPNPIVNILPTNATTCKLTPVQLQASGGATYQWSPAAGLSNDRIASPLALPTVTTTYTVTATDNTGCSATGQTKVTVPEPFTMQAQKTIELCKGDTVKLNASGAQTYKWIRVTNGLSNISIPDPKAAPLTNVTYTVVGFDQYQCYSDTIDVSINVRALPTVNAGPDMQAIFGEELRLSTTSSNDVTRWNWSPATFLSCTNCPTPLSKPFSSMDYVVTAYNQYNCLARDTVHIKATCGGDRVYIPNAFTPDRDGKNDVFTIHGSGISNIISFRVFNRWGEVVYSKKNFFPNDLSSSWNGTFKGVEAPAGIYIYFVEMECSSGERFERKGTVLLTR